MQLVWEPERTTPIDIFLANGKIGAKCEGNDYFAKKRVNAQIWTDTRISKSAKEIKPRV